MDWLLSLSIWGLIGYGYVIFWVCEILPYPEYWLESTGGIVHLLVFHVFIAMMCVTYILAMRTPAGYVPKGWVPPGYSEQELAKARDDAVRDLDHPRPYVPQRLRYCTRCEGFKPPRASHCKDCGRCVMRMDHHCPWVNNCIGFRNQKHFVLFVLYATLVCCWILLIDFYYMYWLLAYTYSHRGTEPAAGIDRDKNAVVLRFAVILSSVILLVPTTAGLVNLASWQLSFAVLNTTTIERREIKWLKSRVSSENLKWKYNYGRYQNLAHLFGPTFLDWPFPTGPHPREGDGTSFYEVAGATDAVALAEAEARSSKSVKIEIDSDDDYESRPLNRPLNSKAK
mmetsp:Transcript_17651/g.49672  ORF Transcript_17651/g.49672 Transcript_17651/m.49672 type:complete len:340 (-) Transcript_17651:68-1087(-)|eukprot:CAMPEP_0119124134 /NCGR_PEP_ID=MMETSP1310-20130426/3841_1 /TAXON_ID=464262 /ORGANISM="Genus nov. species nov., Strain RCC2339" /LENGTH=339 /DNA_ID=CAMNT_0007114031 /DNA_START=230 /DNA_END=1249 /DNA_ORIENTATION=-